MSDSIYFDKDRLKRCQKLRNISNQEIADLLEKDLNTVNYWKRTEKILPEHLAKIAEHLNVSFDYLMGATSQNTYIVKQELAKNPNLPKDPYDENLYILPFRKSEVIQFYADNEDSSLVDKRKKAFFEWVASIPWYPDHPHWNGFYFGDSSKDSGMKSFPVAKLSPYYQSIEEEILNWLDAEYNQNKNSELTITIKKDEKPLLNNILNKWSNLSLENKKIVDSMINALSEENNNNG